MIGKIVNEKYEIEKLIGRGAFGKVYLATNRITLERVAIKVERTSEKQLLEHESRILQKLKNCKHTVSLKWYGTTDKYTFMTMDLLGYSLDTMKCTSPTISFKMIRFIALQLIDGIEYIHNRGIIHRDIKSENAMFGLDNTKRRLHFIDFGLSKYYTRSDNNKHIPFKVGKHPVGTLRYNSINSQRGFEISRRDDIESIGYLLLYLVAPQLPWQGLNILDASDKKQAILTKKELLHKDPIINIRPFIHKIIEYARKLSFEERPNYDLMRSVIHESCANDIPSEV